MKKLTNEEAVGAMMFLYHLQTSDEALKHCTAYNNGVGFSSADAGIMTSFAQQYEIKGTLSEKQLNIVHRIVPKYHRQLSEGGWEALPIEDGAKKKTKDKGKGKPKRVAGVFRQQIKVSFDYHDPGFKDIKDRIKAQINGRQFIKGKGESYWTVPINVANVELLITMGFTLKQNLKEWYEKQTAELSGIRPEGLRGTLMQYQAEDLEHMVRRNGCVLNANEMGLGKTIETIGYIAHQTEQRPVLIIVPSSLKANWKKEFRKFLPQAHTEILQGRTPHIPLTDIAIINYDVIEYWEKTFTKHWVPKLMVIDEAHRIKNEGIRTDAILRIAEMCKSIMPLTGTPVENRPKEIINSLKLVEPELVKNEFAFKQRYCGATHNGYGWNFDGSSNVEELHDRLKYVMIRHRKVDVLKDLPERNISVVPVPMKQQLASKYHKLFKESELTEGTVVNALVTLERLKQAAVEAKWKAAVDWVREYVEQDEKLLVFVTHLALTDSLQETFGSRAVRITGMENPKQRQAAEKRFQEDPSCTLLIGQIRAAGVGLNLTAASHVVFLELDWNPMVHEQAIDRAHRIGQTAGSVNAYYLVGEETIEEDIAQLLDEKKKVAVKVTDGEETEKNQMICELLKRLRERKDGA